MNLAERSQLKSLKNWADKLDVYILDSNVMTFIVKFPRRYPHLLERIKRTPYEHIWVSVISVEEVIRGAFKLRDNEHNPTACYKILAEMVREYGKYQILPYDDDDIAIFDRFTPEIQRGVGAYDRRIAACAIRHDYTIVTQNLREFNLAGSTCVDWTNEETATG